MFERLRSSVNAPAKNHETPVQPQPKPFLIELQQREKTPRGAFLPGARLHVDPVFRTSGLLAALPAEELQSLLWLLTFVSSNGDCRVLLPQLEAAMNLSANAARRRMGQLLAFRWQGAPLVLTTKAESGLVAYVLHPRLVEYVHVEEPAQEEAEAPALPATSRAAVVEYSRRHYAKSRVEVERDIARQLGHEAPKVENEARDTTENGVLTPNQTATPQSPFTASTPANTTAKPTNASTLRRRLENNGLTRDQADKLLATHSWQRIEQQLGWLPFRNAKNPAAFLAAAIEGCYEEPRLLRRHRKCAPQS